MRSLLLGLSATTVLLAACSSERTAGPAGPDVPDPLGLSGQAFRLTIDTRTGKIQVSPPTTANSGSRTGSLSLSLIGSDGIAIHASDCTFTSIPKNSKQKRCSFDLSLTNRLGFTDLLTPTTFPRPPQGTSGILVFPWTASALSVPGGAAIPSPDWDNGPTNFFNDFTGCPNGSASDCYPYELYSSPLYATETTPVRRVGFDVNVNAQSVSAYFVVAADLRDNPQQQITIPGDDNLCGTVRSDGAVVIGPMSATAAALLGPDDLRAFCSFSLPSFLTGKSIARATLRLHENFFALGVGTPSSAIHHLNYGTTLDGPDYFLAPLQANVGTIPDLPTLGDKSVDVTVSVEDDILQARAAAQFRLELLDQQRPTAFVSFDGPADQHPPDLAIVYRNR